MRELASVGKLSLIPATLTTAIQEAGGEAHCYWRFSTASEEAEWLIEDYKLTPGEVAECSGLRRSTR